jgi:TonB-linked SusC/RagA family outer membrane protein
MKKYILSIFFCLMTVVAMSAQVIVKGTVYEAEDEPAIGASIVEKGKNLGVTTDIDGNFQIKVSSPNATLVVSYVGMETQEVALNGRTSVNVTLKTNTTALSEVVIVGYGTQKKINATGAVKTIDNSVLESRPVSNAVQGLQGAVAGLNITNDAGGALGEEMSINIRGVGSIGEGSDSSPLVLIDGMEGDLSSINPNDIANISVLKDAAAASIYGSRAPFGVILVTTKSGEKGTSVSYTGNLRIQQPVKVPNTVSGYESALMINDAYINSGGSAPFSSTILEKMKNYMNGVGAGIDYNSNAVDGWANLQDTYANTNWYDIHLKDASTAQEHNVSVSGGGDKVSYYFSGNYLDQNGIFTYANEKFKRLTVTGKINVKFNDYVSFNWTTRLINTQNKKPSALNDLFFHNLGRRATYYPVTMPDDSAAAGEYYYMSLIPSLQEGGDQIQKKLQVYNQGHLTVKPIKDQDWNIHVELSSRVENNPYTRQVNALSYTTGDGSQRYYSVFDPGPQASAGTYKYNSTTGAFIITPGAGETYYEKAHNQVNYFTTNVYTDYALTLGEKHNLKFLVGEQTEYYKTETTRVATRNVQIQSTPFLPTITGDETTMVSDKKGEWSSVGIFGRINYNYDDRYMAEVNMRGDAASRFPSNQRWGYFPSFSLGWNVANESFFTPVSEWGLHYLKLRASYGTLGNQNTTSYYPYYQQMSTNSGSLVLGGSQATVLPMYSPYSTSLTWEKIENVGAGLDFGLFKNRLTGAFDWYQRTTKDMVGPSQALAAVYGADAPKTNNAEMRVRGWEFEIAWRDRINKDWSYGISASLSDYQSVVTKYDSTDDKISGWYSGKNYGEIWGYNVVGIAKSDAEMAAYLAEHDQSSIGTKWGGGDLMYADLNGDGVVNKGSETLSDHGDLVVIGNTTPRYSYSFTLEGQWKFIDIRAYFQGIGKRDYYFENSAPFFGFGGGAYQRTLYVDHLDYFRYAGSELGANLDSYYGRLRTDANNIQVCDRFLQNAAYLRFKNLQIGFNLPDNTPLKKYVRKARLYFSAENLFTFTSLKIFDPEALSNATYGAGKAYPMYRTYSVGLELTF